MKKKYLLDTNVLISMLKNKGNVRRRLQETGFKNCVVSEISIAELFYGAAKGGRMENFNDVKLILQKFEVIPIYPYLESYGRVKASLEAQGQRIDDFDILIGVTALQNNYTMVTANIKHLGRIPNLNIENWE